jgi:hypothetical protein
MSLPGRPSLYTVTRTRRFQTDVSAIKGVVRRWTEISETLIWVLSREPKSGQQISDTGVWSLPFESTPFITVYYSIDEASRTVTLEAAFKLNNI